MSLSILLGFFAVVSDLTQTLLRIKKVHDGVSIDSAVPFIIAREVLFAIAVGLRFTAIWAFVAEAPRGEAAPVDERDQRPTNLLVMGSDASSLHSGAWDRCVFAEHVPLIALFTTFTRNFVLLLMHRPTDGDSLG